MRVNNNVITREKKLKQIRMMRMWISVLIVKAVLYLVRN